MEENFVHLTSSGGPFQTFVIEEALKAAGIPYTILDRTPAKAIIGGLALENEEFTVPAGRLEEAKDVLCGNGIVCEVSERLLRRSLEEIVMPLLRGEVRDQGRLVRFMEVNNKETVRALVDATLALPGGQELLTDIFFSLDRKEDAAALRSMARALASKVDDLFLDRLKEAVSTRHKDARMALLEAIPEFHDVPGRAEVLAIALADPDIEVREAAAEALFALKRGDYGYEPDAPEEQRAQAIRRFLAS
jgi:hypothetical protein